MHKTWADHLDFAIRMAAINPNGFRKAKNGKHKKQQAGFDQPTYIETLAGLVYGGAA